PRYETPAACADHRRNWRKGFALGDIARRMLDLGKLAGGEVARERFPFGEPGLAYVAPKHASEPACTFFRTLPPLVGGRAGVRIFRQIPRESPDIGHGGEALRGNSLHLAPKWG